MSHIEETMKRLHEEGITAYLKNPKTGVITVMPRGLYGPVLTYHVGSGTIDGFLLRKGLDAVVELSKKLQSVAVRV